LFYQEVFTTNTWGWTEREDGTVSITFGITTDLIGTVLGNAPLRLAAEFDTVEIHVHTRKAESGTQDAE